MNRVIFGVVSVALLAFVALGAVGCASKSKSDKMASDRMDDGGKMMDGKMNDSSKMMNDSGKMSAETCKMSDMVASKLTGTDTGQL